MAKLYEDPEARRIAKLREKVQELAEQKLERGEAETEALAKSAVYQEHPELANRLLEAGAPPPEEEESEGEIEKSDSQEAAAEIMKAAEVAFDRYPQLSRAEAIKKTCKENPTLATRWLANE